MQRNRCPDRSVVDIVVLHVVAVPKVGADKNRENTLMQQN